MPLCSSAFSGMELKEPQNLKVKKIIIDSIVGDGIVTFHDKPDVRIQILGNDEILKNIEVHNRKEILKITSQHPEKMTKGVLIRAQIPSNVELSLGIVGTGDWNIEKIGAPSRINIMGSGNVEIKSIEAKSLHIKSVGSGTVTVKKGNVKDFNAKLVDEGLIEFGGTTQNAKLNVIGSGKIIISEITQKIQQKNIIGNGRVKIKKMAESDKP